VFRAVFRFDGSINNRFAPQPATGSAGLYRSQATINGTQFVAGWIVDFGGIQVGSITDLFSGRQIPAPALAPDAIAAKQVAVPTIGVFPILFCGGGSCA